MKREDALLFKKIFEVEQNLGRDFYTGDLVNAGILPRASCQKKVEEMKDKGFLKEMSLKGANVYQVSSKGLFHLNAYRDIRLELQRKYQIA